MIMIYRYVGSKAYCGNDQADKAARSTINLTTEKKFKIPHTDFK